VEDLCLDVWGCVCSRCDFLGGVAWSTVAWGRKGDIKVFTDSVGVRGAYIKVRKLSFWCTYGLSWQNLEQKSFWC
jgi:hypothetical protein